ncbi:MAG: radical SAM family heme chaperone HemW [Myxococcota bacterium]
MSPQTSSAAPAGDLGLYVHVPFCEHVCPYCDFAVLGVGRLPESDEDAFVDSVLRELALAVESVAGREVASVYFGGGTPSLLRPGSIARLLEAFRAELRFAAPEITVELNPGQLEVSRVPQLRALGVTRLSIGLQALDDTVLRRLGRAQAGAQALRGLEVCLAAGFASLSADLIYGVPGQSLETLLGDVERVIELGVPHVSGYALTLEPGTPFALAAERGKLDLPDEDTLLAMSRLLRARLFAAGIAQYEISSYARAGHRSRHNQRYWQRRDVLGLGPSAASLVSERRFRNARELGAWRALLAEGHSPVVESERLSEGEARREALFLGLRRLEGVRRADFLRRFGAAPEAFFAAELDALRERGLICDEAGAIKLSERGILFADEVFMGLVGDDSGR